MKILLVDTTTKDLVVAIITENQILDGTLAGIGTQHSEKLCFAVQDLLQKNNLTFADLDAYAASVGPGSFTGIRIGVSTVKGYNVAMGKKLIEINCLQAIANSANCGNKGYAIIDAGNGYYFADYNNNVAPCLVDYNDSRVAGAGSAQTAIDYFDGAVLLARNKYASKDFVDDLTAVYIRKSQAEVERENKK